MASVRIPSQEYKARHYQNIFALCSSSAVKEFGDAKLLMLLVNEAYLKSELDGPGGVTHSVTS